MQKAAKEQLFFVHTPQQRMEQKQPDKKEKKRTSI
jgi:hypothetical protein